MKVGPWTFNGPQSALDILKPHAAKFAQILLLPDGKSRVRPASVNFRKNDDMPWAVKPDTDPYYPKGVKARGYWYSASNTMLLNENMIPTPELLWKTFAHEAYHHLDDDWMVKSNQRDLRPLFDPDAAAYPGEEAAVWGSAAVFGFSDPPYKKFYPRYRLPVGQWAEFKRVSLRDDHVDPCAPYKAEIETLKTALNDVTQQLMAEQQAHAATKSLLDVANDRLAKKDAKADELKAI